LVNSKPLLIAEKRLPSNFADTAVAPITAVAVLPPPAALLIACARAVVP